MVRTTRAQRAAAAVKKEKDKKSKATGGRTRTRSRRKSKTNVNVDFTGTESRVLLPAGEYELKVSAITIETGKESKEDYLAWVFKTFNVDEDRYNNQPLYFNTSLQTHALWSLRNLLEAMDVEIPEGAMDLVFEDLLDLEILGVVEQRTFDGKLKSDLVDFLPMDAGSGDEKVDVVEGEGEGGELELIAETEVDAMSEDELEDLVKEYDLDVDLSKISRMKKKAGAVCDALEDKQLLSD